MLIVKELSFALLLRLLCFRAMLLELQWSEVQSHPIQSRESFVCSNLFYAKPICLCSSKQSSQLVPSQSTRLPSIRQNTYFTNHLILKNELKITGFFSFRFTNKDSLSWLKIFYRAICGSWCNCHFGAHFGTRGC